MRLGKTHGMEPQRHTHQHQWRSRPLLALAALLTTAIAAPVIAAPAAHANVRVRVVAASRDYSISIPADAQVVAAGGTATYPLILRTGSRFRGAVFFEVVGLPAGVSTRVVSLGRNSFSLQLTTAPNLPSSSTVSILRAISAGRVREALLRLTINGAPPVTQPPATVPPVTAPPPTAPPQTVPPAPVFGLVVNTPQNTASTDQQVQYFVNVDRSAGYQGNVTFYVSGLPAGTTGGFGPNCTLNPCQTRIVRCRLPALAAGDYTVVAPGSPLRIVHVRDGGQSSCSLPANQIP